MLHNVAGADGEHPESPIPLEGNGLLQMRRRQHSRLAQVGDGSSQAELVGARSLGRMNALLAEQQALQRCVRMHASARAAMAVCHAAALARLEDALTENGRLTAALQEQQQQAEALAAAQTGLHQLLCAHALALTERASAPIEANLQQVRSPCCHRLACCGSLSE